MPAWLRELAESACECCVCPVRGRATGLSVAWSPPDESEYGCWLVDVRPQRFEVVGGRDDGRTGYSPVYIDLLGLPGCLDEADALQHEPGGPDEGPHVLLEGEKAGEVVIVRVWLSPEEGDEPAVALDLNDGSIRPRRGGPR
jgi:hypothetical protein